MVDGAKDGETSRSSPSDRKRARAFIDKHGGRIGYAEVVEYLSAAGVDASVATSLLEARCISSERVSPWLMRKKRGIGGA